MLRVIPLRGSSTAPTVRQTVVLDGVLYLLELQWNGREGCWFMHIFDANSVPVALGIKLVVNTRLGARVRDRRMPKGFLMLLDPSGSGRGPGIGGLIDSVVLVYRDAADLSRSN